jgi:hypothetical protein
MFVIILGNKYSGQIDNASINGCEFWVVCNIVKTLQHLQIFILLKWYSCIKHMYGYM